MGFETVKLKDLTINLDNKRKPLNELERKSLKKKGLYPYCGANGVLDYIDEFIFDQEILCIAEDGGSWGFREKCAYIMNEPCWVNNHAHVLVAKENVNVKYLCYYLNYADLSKHITGTTRGKLTKSALEKIEVKIPDYSTQNKIVNALDKAQELIDKRKAQIEALDQLTQSVFLEMFGDPMLNKKQWPKKKLGNICSIVRGGSPRPIEKFLGGHIPWIKISDATKGDSIYLKNTKEFIIEEGVKKSRLIKKGSLIFANCGVSLGFARIITFDGCIHDGWLAFEDISNYVNKIFLLKLLNQFTDYFRKTAPDGTQPNLNTTIMKNFEVILPPIELQNRFANIVLKIESQKDLLQKSLEELENNFNSLMQRAFKGELFND